MRHSNNKQESKLFSDNIKKSFTLKLKKKIPELSHNATKKMSDIPLDTINFKDIFYLEPLESKFTRRMFRKEESEFFQETLKNEHNKKLAIVNRKFKQILTKIEKKELPNGFNKVLLDYHNEAGFKKDRSARSVEISLKVVVKGSFYFYQGNKNINFPTEESKTEKSLLEKDRLKKRSASFSYPLKRKESKPFPDENLYLKISSTQTLLSKSVSRESLVDINKKKSEELMKRLKAESPFIENFILDEGVKFDTSQEIKGNLVKWREEMIIGCGTYGRVMKAFDVERGRIIAVKKIDIILAFGNDRNSVSNVEAEMSILKNLRHPNIIEFYGCEQIDHFLYLYLEYMSMGNLADLMKKCGRLDEFLIRNYSRQILEGLKYLHDQRIIHKDIKAANILLNENGLLKLADFGSAQQLERTFTMSLHAGNKNLSIYGSIPWMAPEVIRQTKYGRKADIWSFGCTVLEMAQGKAPWSEHNFDNPIAAIMKIGVSQEIPVIPENLNSNLKNFILCCLQRDANKRPHAKDLLGHPFLEDIL